MLGGGEADGALGGPFALSSVFTLAITDSLFFA